VSSIEYVPFGFGEDETSHPLDNPDYRDELIETFQGVFTAENSPYDEDWSYEDVDEFLEWTSQVEYAGVLAFDTVSDELAGFTWGYRIDPEDELINPDEKFPDGIEDVVPEVYDGGTFMLDEIGVDPEYRLQGIGSELESRLLQELGQSSQIEIVMQRTQWSGENTGKLRLDGRMGFQALLQGEDNDPVTQEVPFVGTDGSDERIYLLQELDGEKPWK
jgi:ribosomal protein S18 acetylase RimI-like enzyme